jgi:hypothetical protein
MLCHLAGGKLALTLFLLGFGFIETTEGKRTGNRRGTEDGQGKRLGA